MGSTTLPQPDIAPARVAWPSLTTALKGLSALLALLTVLVFQFWPTLTSYFMADDFIWLGLARNSHGVWALATQLSPWGFVMSVPLATFSALFAMFGYNATGYYIVNLLLHIANVCLVYYLVSLVTGRRKVALVTSFLFAVLFIHWSDWGPVVWISAFVHLITASLYLASLAFFIRYLDTRQIADYLASIGLFSLALLSKEVALSLPLLLLCVVLLRRKAQGRAFFPFAPTIPFFLILAMYLTFELPLQTAGSYVSQGHYGLGLQLITNWADFSNLVLPNPKSGPVQSFLSRSASLTAIHMYDIAVFSVRAALLGLAALITIFGSRVARFWLAFMIVTYLPFLPWGEGFAGPNRYFYLPAIAFCALLALGSASAYQWLRARLGLTRSVALLTAIALVFWAYNLVPTRIWQQQMLVNSEVRRTAVRLTTSGLAGIPGLPPTVELQGFPDKYGDLRYGLADLLGVKTEWTAASSNAEVSAPDKLVLQYNNGRIEVYQGAGENNDASGIGDELRQDAR